MEALSKFLLNFDWMINEGEVENCMTISRRAINTKCQHLLSILLCAEGSTGFASLHAHDSFLRYEALASSFDRGSHWFMR